jgi:hypothetical protein
MCRKGEEAKEWEREFPKLPNFWTSPVEYVEMLLKFRDYFFLSQNRLIETLNGE